MKNFPAFFNKYKNKLIMAYDGKGSIAIMTGKKLDLSQKYLAFARSHASET